MPQTNRSGTKNLQDSQVSYWVILKIFFSLALAAVPTKCNVDKALIACKPLCLGLRRFTGWSLGNKLPPL